MVQVPFDLYQPSRESLYKHLRNLVRGMSTKRPVFPHYLKNSLNKTNNNLHFCSYETAKGLKMN